ncbi:sterol desaturase family protein [uncultured Paraglaciecola sp.]|uniref:sterol desaturase family protein n=1 Tax=uncultured Paraglaciecola sp. TaxID=1765024 RepID=UPI002632119A|nr:sterol desaturase family protein [uncultured Paraglaciecola sp.]
MNIILYAVPFFFLLIFLELLLEKIKGTDYYRVNDAINSLTAGVLSRMTGIVKQLFPLSIYVMIYEQLAFFNLAQSWWVWLIAFVLYDFCYYWNHRLGHEMNLLWASHVVHHSSEEYNLTTALRQSGSSFFSFVFYIPMALMGFDPVVLITVGSLNLIYQYWVHTRHIPKLGWYEWFFVTPSNHRVHHAQNQIYIDRNYGGVFILWDRLFGSFQEELEDEKPIYGIRKALKSWNPLWANVHVYAQLCKDCWHAKRWQDKLLIWFKRTGWRPADVEQNYPLGRVDLTKFRKFDIPLTLTNKCYSLLQYSLISFVGLLLMINIAVFSVPEQLAVVFFVLFGSVSAGMVLENNPLAIYSEWTKCGLILLTLVFYSFPHWIELVLGISILINATMLSLKKSDIINISEPMFEAGVSYTNLHK